MIHSRHCEAGRNVAAGCRVCRDDGRPSWPASAAPTDPSSDLEVGKSLATYIDLEMEFALESGSDRMVDCLLPRDSADIFIAFLRWAARRGVEGDAR